MRRHSQSGSDNDRGSASVLGVFLVIAVGIVAIAAFAVVQLALAHQRAMSAADLAATAAYTMGCEVASEIAQANGAQLAHCLLADAASDDVLVTAVVRTPALLRRILGPLAPEGIAASSRAGASQ